MHCFKEPAAVYSLSFFILLKKKTGRQKLRGVPSLIPGSLASGALNADQLAQVSARALMPSQFPSSLFNKLCQKLNLIQMEEKSKDGFDYKKFEEEALEQLRSGKKIEGKDGILAPLIKRLVEAGLKGEMNAHLSEARRVNRCNGKTGKQVKTAFGSAEINTPRDQLSSFEPQLLPKRQTTLGEALDHKVISLYGRGISYSDICKHLEELYGLDVSPATLSAITDSVIEEVNAWRNRPLESVYPFVWPL